MRLGDWERNRLAYDSYVLADAAIVYMATPKVASTSFKHVIATLAGIDVGNLPPSSMAAKSRELGIHDRSVINLPSVLDLPEGMRAEALTSDGFLRICIVRNPYYRLVSAWVDRILCHSLSPIAPIMQHLEFPKYIPDRLYLRGKFAEFVNHLYRKEFPNFTNHHWQKQYDLLLPHLMNYNLVIRIEELSQTLPLMIRHVEKHGLTWPGLPRINELKFKMSNILYTESVARKVAAMYEQDFMKFDYPNTLENVVDELDILPDVEVMTAIQKKNQRIFYLSLKYRGLI